ncbi:MAG: hypothetical protein QOH84_1520 [Kribbellaceae bacterium]|nr:hypothetical protein [Kribbellaceae bacterium]
MTPSPVQRTLILDTDIGSDVDDAMALAQILGTPTATLHSVTTVYGDTRLRAQIARRYGALAGRNLKVYAGESAPISGKAVWWPGHEGTLHPEISTEQFQDEHAVNHLIAAVTARPGELDIVAIGPLTNIAAALTRERGIATAIRHLWVMGGSFGRIDETEHNFRSDDVAASVVFGAGIPTTVTGLDVTRQITMGPEQLAQISDAGRIGSALGADIEQWWAYWNETWNVPHDPVAVLTLTRPDLFAFTPPGVVEIELGGTGAGRSTFHPDEGGTTRVATEIQGASAAAAITGAIVASAPPTSGTEQNRPTEGESRSPVTHRRGGNNGDST